MKLIYIAGPFRSKNRWELEQNVRKAEEVAYEVAAFNAVPVCPHTMYRNFDGTLTDGFWLEATTELLSVCDAMIVVCTASNGVVSTGTEAEIQYAVDSRIPIFYSFKKYLDSDFYKENVSNNLAIVEKEDLQEGEKRKIWKYED